jgi:hypothetical protein
MDRTNDSCVVYSYGVSNRVLRPAADLISGQPLKMAVGRACKRALLASAALGRRAFDQPQRSSQ